MQAESIKWNPSDVANFIQVARTLNITRAAERLGIGQPALSQSIQRLEYYFGVQLLDRFKTGVRLTAAGERLRDAGMLTLTACSKLKDHVLAAEHAIQGRFTLGVHPSVAIYSLPAFLKDLLQDHEGLSMSLLHGLSREILEAVVSFRADFGIVVNPVRHPDLVIKELCRDRIGFWSVPDANRRVLIYEPDLLQSRTLISQLSERFTRVIESSNLEVVAALTECGVGVGILPTRVAKRTGNLTLLTETPFVDDKICFIYRADRHLSAAQRHIINVIRKARF